MEFDKKKYNHIIKFAIIFIGILGIYFLGWRGGTMYVEQTTLEYCDTKMNTYGALLNQALEESGYSYIQRKRIRDKIDEDIEKFKNGKIHILLPYLKDKEYCN